MHFFNFFQIFDYHVIRLVKGQKIVQNDKKICLLCLISQELYIVWSSLMVHMWNMIISPGFFHLFQIFIFGVNSGVVWKGKKWKNGKKLMPVIFHISGSMHHMIVNFDTYLWNDDIFRWPKMTKILSVSLSTSGTVHHMIVVFGTDV